MKQLLGKRLSFTEMILTTEYKPKSILEEFVVCFYYNRSDNIEYYGHTNPTIYQELFFNLGDRFELQNTDGRVNCKRNWLSGIQSKSSIVKTSGRHITAGVIFKPWGLYAAFGINAKEIYNKVIDGKVLVDFENELNESESSDKHFFDLMEHSLTKSLKVSNMTITMKRIVNDLERENLTILSEELSRSKKSIIESFNKIVGVSPQKYYTLKCICETISILQNNPSIKLTELAYTQGFYDQAHFIRVFKEYTGFTPKEFRSKNIET